MCVCVCVCVVCYIHKEVFDTIIPEQVDILEYLNYLFFNSVTQSLSLSLKFSNTRRKDFMLMEFLVSQLSEQIL